MSPISAAIWKRSRSRRGVSSISVWDDLADTVEEAENLKVRSGLMIAINNKLDEFGWSQTKAASMLGLTQPRGSALRNGHISAFSIDALVTIGAKVGVHVTVRASDTPDFVSQ